MPKNPFQPAAQFRMDMTDDAVVTFTGPDLATGGVKFHDEGYMPVTQLTLAGNRQLPPGLDHFFISYHGDGVQTFSALAADASYTGLQYDLIGYKGPNASFSVAGGKPIVSGAHNLTVLAHGEAYGEGVGNLHIAFSDFGHTQITGITGQVNAPMQIDGQTVGKLHIDVNHDGSDAHWIFGANSPLPSGLTLEQGMLHATFTPLNVG